MIDPYAQRRPDEHRRDWLRFRRRLLLGTLLVAAAVLASVATEQVASLVSRDLSGGSVSIGIGLTVFNLIMFALAHLIPPLMVAAGVALPLVGIYQYREAMMTPRRRGRRLEGAMPVGRATALGWITVGCLLVVSLAGIVYLNPSETRDRGVAEPFLIYEEPPYIPVE